MTNRLIPTSEVCYRAGKKSRVTLWRWIKAGLFPKPRQVGPSGSGNLWLESELEEFFNDPEDWTRKHQMSDESIKLRTNSLS